MTNQTTKTIARLVGGLSLGALVALTGCKSSEKGGDAPADKGADAEPAASQPAEGGGESSCGGEGGCGGDGSCGGDGK